MDYEYKRMHPLKPKKETRKKKVKSVSSAVARGGK